MIAAAGIAGVFALRPGLRLATGKEITPLGDSVDVGNFPSNLLVSPDGRFVVSTNAGFDQRITVMNAETGEVVSSIPFNGKEKSGRDAGLYYGLAMSADGTLYASMGAADQIAVFHMSPDGSLKQAEKNLTLPLDSSRKGLSRHISGLALSSDGSTLYAANNQTGVSTEFAGRVSQLDLKTGTWVRDLPCDGFPMATLCVGDKLFVACELHGEIDSINLTTGLRKVIPVGRNAVGLTLGKNRNVLYASSAGADVVTAIDVAKDQALWRTSVRPKEFASLPGCSPLGLTLSEDGSRLLVALADFQSLASLDSSTGKVQGYVPTGWYPTAVAACKGKLFVSNARGSVNLVPNGKDVKEHYILDALRGSLERIDPSVLESLSESTAQVMANNRVREAREIARSFKNPGIKHVIYVIKENRTYDQVLGDLPQADGDSSLVMYGREITPNQHALAERFALMDRFFVCAEVSADGWNWSTSSMANEYTSRNTTYNYSGRGRDYDFEGTTNGYPVDLSGIPDVAESSGGYLWDNALVHGASVRNYGMFLSFGTSKEVDKRGSPLVKDNRPDKRALENVSDVDFRRYDLAYADSDAFTKFNFKHPRAQMETFGSHHAPSRISEFRQEYERYEKLGKAPSLMLMRLGRDHTAGTSPGQYTPSAMVADNDYAIGQLVDIVSHGPFWKDTAIFIVEDDAQGGQDHIDAHRSIAQVISPYVARATVSHDFYNTSATIHTMELLLGLPPMTQYDAIARPFAFLTGAPTNSEPYEAILPAESVITATNQRTAYRAADSLRLVQRFGEDDEEAATLNDILWHDVKGAKTPMPRTPGLITSSR